MSKTTIHEFVTDSAEPAYQPDADALKALETAAKDINALRGHLFAIGEMYGWDESDRDAWAALKRLGKQFGVSIGRAPKR